MPFASRPIAMLSCRIGVFACRIGVLLWACWPLVASHAEAQASAGELPTETGIELQLGILQQPAEIVSAVPDYLRPAGDEGLAGALQAVADSNRTGKFLRQHITLHTAQLSVPALQSDPAQLISQAQAWVAAGSHILLVDLSTANLQALRKQLPEYVLLINIGNRDDSLRRQLCLPNTLHTRASYSMQTDALAQWMRSRRLSKVLLVSGSSPQDAAYADAVKHSISKFGHKLVEQKVWQFETDLRRVAGTELQAFTRTDDYDLVWVADTANLFGQLLPYNTHLPRPVIGTHGMLAAEWSGVIEAWGAVQLQNRFRAQFNRAMTDKDFAAWIAVRALSEALIQSRSAEVTTLRTRMLAPDFSVAGYMGRKLSFRPWNGQLRQPIPLFHQQALVASAPLDGFLHPSNEMDTLGADRRESRCQLSSTE
ncbi:ABC transporter substrate-binding protein [Shewanella sp. GXUN23E]|uniref:ABC transporter substrate-binding protein n=1 Tax=Shewanella sp. GXUN23E TaxID=3422498 RepID=UPI003D7C769B